MSARCGEHSRYRNVPRPSRIAKGAARLSFRTTPSERSVLQPCKIVDAHAEKARHGNEFGERRLTLAQLPQADDGLTDVQLLGKLDLSKMHFIPQFPQSLAKDAVHASYFPIFMELWAILPLSW